MKKIIFCFMVITVLLFASDYPLEFKGREIKTADIDDGDTFKMKYYNKVLMSIRLYGVDAPEMDSKNALPTTEGCYAQIAKDFLISKISDKKVDIQIVGKASY